MPCHQRHRDHRWHRRHRSTVIWVQHRHGQAQHSLRQVVPTMMEVLQWTAQHRPLNCRGLRQGSLCPAFQVEREHPAPAHTFGCGASIDRGLQFADATTVAPASAGLPDVPIFAVRDGKVHCGGAIYVESGALEHALKAKSDSMFCQEMMRTVWEPSQLIGRSATGQASRRCLQEVHLWSHGTKARCRRSE